jgi:two-component system, LytTR family, sensor histidine kinase AlgZ
MHPILTSWRALVGYLLVWMPVTALMVYVSRSSGGLSWTDAIAVLAPVCLVYSFVCLSPFYIGRGMPPVATQIRRLAATWVAAAAAAAALFLGGLRAAALALDTLPAFRGLDLRLQGRTALLFGMALLLYLLSAGLHYAAQAVEESRDAERRAAESRTLAREAELQALRIQLNPHFLFNSLHSIAALATVDSARAREMCVRLGGFLRSSLELGARESIPLREEVALACAYIEVEQVRFGDRLKLDLRVEAECEECPTLALLLQPLVENAVKHGIAGLVAGGSIRLEARRASGWVAITIENDFDPEAPAPHKNGLGLSHVRRRLEMRYAGEAVFEAGPRGPVYRVSLRFPAASPMDPSPMALSSRA